MQEPENTLKQKVVEADNSLKEMFVQYVGEKLQPKNGEVTVEMVVEVLADEFPDFLLVVAEENFIRGYRQALVDVESWDKTENLENEQVS
jgi:hypothetical protein